MRGQADEEELKVIKRRSWLKANLKEEIYIPKVCNSKI